MVTGLTLVWVTPVHQQVDGARDRRLPHDQRRGGRHHPHDPGGGRRRLPQPTRPPRRGRTHVGRADLLRRRHAALRLGARRVPRRVTAGGHGVHPGLRPGHRCRPAPVRPRPPAATARHGPRPSLGRPARGRHRRHVGRDHPARAVLRHAGTLAGAGLGGGGARDRTTAPAGSGAASSEPIAARLRGPALPGGADRHPDRPGQSPGDGRAPGHPARAPGADPGRRTWIDRRVLRRRGPLQAIQRRTRTRRGRRAPRRGRATHRRGAGPARVPHRRRRVRRRGRGIGPRRDRHASPPT